MKTRMEVTNPGEISITATITMSLKDWRALGEVLPDAHPYYKLSSEINSMTLQAGKTFFPEEQNS